MDAEETLYRSDWEQYIVLGGNMRYCITFHPHLCCSLIMAETTWRVTIWNVTFIFSCLLFLLLNLNFYCMPLKHACIHTLSLLLCYRRRDCSSPFYLAYVTAAVFLPLMFPDAFPFLPSWCYPLGVCIPPFSCI